jgi:succinyl-diaminopimelate desuccinylase
VRAAGHENRNFDGYAGHAEFGEGEEIVAMLGHLDVVPPGTGGRRSRSARSSKTGRLYARGASDDKGPTFAACSARRRSWTVWPRRRKTVAPCRLIFGCDEESGWQCMDHLFRAAGQPKPDLAFTPDADFPLIYAEKGAFTGVASERLTAAGGALTVAAFQSGLRVNMVPATPSALPATRPPPRHRPAPCRHALRHSGIGER